MAVLRPDRDPSEEARLADDRPETWTTPAERERIRALCVDDSLSPEEFAEALEELGAGGSVRLLYDPVPPREFDPEDGIAQLVYNRRFEAALRWADATGTKLYEAERRFNIHYPPCARKTTERNA